MERVLWCLPGRVEVELRQARALLPPKPAPESPAEEARRTRKRADRGIAGKRWAETVKARDGHACRECGATSGLHAHHLLPTATHPELRYSIANGVTLCRAHHRLRHPELPASLFR